MAEEEPTWQALSRLHLVGSIIDQGVADAETQYRLLLKAKHVPHVLDDHTVERTVKVYGETRDDVWVFEEQMRRLGGTQSADSRPATRDRPPHLPAHRVPGSRGIDSGRRRGSAGRDHRGGARQDRP